MSPAFVSWQSGRKPGAPYLACSPNLKALRTYLTDRWALTDLGCYGRRPIRGGTAWSSHAFGAAVDIGYTDRAVVESEILPWLLDNAKTLGIQRVHDYIARRYWQSGRGWIFRPPGIGGKWLHIETHPDTWADARPVADRLDTPAPGAPVYPGRVIKVGASGDAVVAIQHVVGATPDGHYGPLTEAAVTAWQVAHGLEADGRVGRKTWSAMFPDDMA